MKRIAVLPLLLMVTLIVAGAHAYAPSNPGFELSLFTPPEGVLIEEVVGPEREAFINKALQNSGVLKLQEVLKFNVLPEQIVVKRAEFKGKASFFALIPSASYTIIYWSAGNCEGAMAVNKQGGYYIEGDKVKAFSAQELLKLAPEVLSEGQSKLEVKARGTVIPLSTSRPGPLIRCPECWDVLFSWCSGPCKATYCYGYCCYNVCEKQGYCVITGPCWTGSASHCCNWPIAGKPPKSR